MEEYHADEIDKCNGNSFQTLISFNNPTYNNAQSANYTKATPCLQADILGDWREELVLWNKKDSTEIMIFTTWTPTNYSVPTLMHDHVYRMGVAWQNTAYNQPPHLGYYLPDYISGKLTGIITMSDVRSEMSDVWYTLDGQKLSSKPVRNGIYIHQGQKVVINDMR
jgi:rhamnogalacturonan endolyase